MVVMFTSCFVILQDSSTLCFDDIVFTCYFSIHDDGRYACGELLGTTNFALDVSLYIDPPSSRCIRSDIFLQDPPCTIPHCKDEGAWKWKGG